MQGQFDLVIIGGGCVGVAAAYYALRQNLKVCLIDQGDMSGEAQRYWSSSFSARQNRVQYNEEYLTRFVLKSNLEWEDVEEKLNKKGELLLKEGSVWFGDKNVNTNQGNIKAANAVITIINSNSNEPQRIQSLYMEKIMQGSPEYMRAFRPTTIGGKTSQWDAWSALYQPDGGSVNMQAAYQAFTSYIDQNPKDKFTLFDKAQITAHTINVQGPRHRFSFNKQGQKIIDAHKVFICAGVFTPHFLKNIMDFPYLVDSNFKGDEANLQYAIQEYVASYIRVKESGEQLWSNMPNWYNFLEESSANNEYSGYGFRFHCWDNNDADPAQAKYIKLGTMAFKGFSSAQEQEDYLKNPKYTVQYDPNSQDPQKKDLRVLAALKYAENRLCEVDPNDPGNRHFTCPIIFISGRETLLDYLQRNDETVVVQCGGWIGKYYPLLASTAIDMLFDAKNIKDQRAKPESVISNFLNRTRFPIKPYIKKTLAQMRDTKLPQKFNTLIVGAGCSGLYSAYRLHKTDHANIGVFQISDRISGRLKSFNFKGTSTHFQLGGMRYIPYKHILLNKVITDLAIPSQSFPMEGDPIQNSTRRAYLRNDYYQSSEWESNQSNNHRLVTSYRMKGHIVGMNSFQIISFSLYMILTAPENIWMVEHYFKTKPIEDIDFEKQALRFLGKQVPQQDKDYSYYRNWKNYIFVTPDNPLDYNVNLTLRQWNQLKPILLHRFPYEIKSRDVYEGLKQVQSHNLYPLYKFGFQNVIEAQFGHEAYQFVAQQNGYFSYTSNASYLDQVMAYLLDFGKVAYNTLNGGFDNINYGMANELLSEHSGLQTKNGGIYLGHKLINIQPAPAQHTSQKQNAKDKPKQYILTFHVKSKCSSQEQLNLYRSPLLARAYPEGGATSQIVKVRAEKIILAMPKKSIQLLYNQIRLLQAPIDTYQTLQRELKAQYEKIFDLKYLERQIKNVKTKQPHNTDNGAQHGKQHKQQHKIDSILHQNHYQERKQQRIFLQNRRNQLKQRLASKAIQPKNLNALAESTQAMPAMKICMNFTQNWWDPTKRINKEYQQKYRNMNLISSAEQMRGVSVTDLPIRQTLYFGEGPDNLLLGSYNDMITTEFWKTLNNNFDQEWEPCQCVKKKKEARACKSIISYPQDQHIVKAKKVLVKEVLKQLSLIHNITVEEKWVKECVYQFWGDDPFGAGYHNFYSGYYIPAIMASIRKPWQNESIHIVGQAYSNQTGWVQGAFQTAEKLLTEHFGLEKLISTYYAGY